MEFWEKQPQKRVAPGVSHSPLVHNQPPGSYQITFKCSYHFIALATSAPRRQISILFLPWGTCLSTFEGWWFICNSSSLTDSRKLSIFSLYSFSLLQEWEWCLSSCLCGGAKTGSYDWKKKLLFQGRNREMQT